MENNNQKLSYSQIMNQTRTAFCEAAKHSSCTKWEAMGVWAKAGAAIGIIMTGYITNRVVPDEWFA